MPGPPLVEIEACDDVVVCRIEEELDACAAPMVRQGLSGAVGSRGLVIDLGRVRFIDSSGLGVLVGIVRRAREVGGRVVLCAATPAVARALDVVGLPRIVAIVSDSAQARRALEGLPLPSRGSEPDG